MDNLRLVWEVMGPGIAGAVFGAGWWFWVDAVVCSAVNIPFLHYLPGIFASLAALMFNCVSKDQISYDYYSPYGDNDWSSHVLAVEFYSHWELSRILRSNGS